MKKGFTLLELIIVIIVLGVLVGIALPTYIRTVEKARSAEGRTLLGAIRSAQMRYKAEKGSYANTVAALDVDYTTPKYFTVNNPAGTTAEVGKVIRTGGYTLIISEAGDITCTDGAITCAQGGF